MVARARFPEVSQTVTPPDGEDHRLPSSLIDAWRFPKGGRGASAVLSIAALLAGGGLLVSLSGGIASPLVHFMYAPILLSALFFRTAGGLTAAALAGLIVGPWVPAAGPGEPATTGWVASALFFLTAGVAAGQAQGLLDQRLRHSERLVEKLATVQARTLSTFVSTVDLRDQSTGGHSVRVGYNARALAIALGLDHETVRSVYWAGLLHDLGKIAVPERILQKPGRLTGEEVKVMRRHSNVGATLLLSVSSELRPIAEGVRAHHERWDGQGYPQGLAGEAIPLSGRILTIVDVFEALTSTRPYRQPAPAQEVLRVLREGAGSSFDPDLVPVFQDLVWTGSIFTAAEPKAVLAVDEPAVLLADDEVREPLVRAALADHHLGSSGRP